MTTKYLMNTNQNDQGLTLDRRRALRLVVGAPLVFAVISAAGCAGTDIRPAEAPKPKSYITADPD